MKRISVSFERVHDTTGYLFSFAKCLSAALSCSPYKDFAEDAIAASGFAFRMWVDGEQLCPSSTSIWDFAKQKEWVENSGLVCGYVQRLWGEDALEESRRREAIDLLKRSIDAGAAGVVWDLSGCEWGLVIGYDDAEGRLLTKTIQSREVSLPYEKLGALEIPILSVLTVTGERKKSEAQLLADTKRLAISHLKGEEWCENSKGLAAYDTLVEFLREKLTADTAWNLEYLLGNYAALKWYAWKFFEKYGDRKWAEVYRKVYHAWQEAFDLVCGQDITAPDRKERLVTLLSEAKSAESNLILAKE